MTQVGDASGATGGPDQSTKDQAKEKVQETAQQVQQKAGEVKEQARGRLTSELDNRSTQAGEQVQSVAGSVRRTSENLRIEGQEGPAKIMDAVAERAERFGGYLKQSDADRMLRDVEDFARRQPWLFAVGGLALGFVASRFLKASSGRRYESQSSNGQRSWNVDMREEGAAMYSTGRPELPSSTSPSTPQIDEPILVPDTAPTGPQAGGSVGN
jgi:hypothetical protein